MNIVFAGQMSKDSFYSNLNEDQFAIDLERGRISLSDGASESFDSHSWAHLLVNQYIMDPKITYDWIQNLIIKYKALHNFESLSWSKQASYERGSFATLLGVEIDNKKSKIEVVSIGDSLAILLEDNLISDSYPYKSCKDFQNRPNLISTNVKDNDFIQSLNFLNSHSISWNLKRRKNISLLLMTDALGEWTLRQEEQGVSACYILKNIQTEEQFLSLVNNERSQNNMHVDDATLIHIAFNEPISDDLSES